MLLFKITKCLNKKELIKMGANIEICGKNAIIKGECPLRGNRVCAADLRGGAALVLAGLFAAGVLFGTAGIKALSSKDAKKLYTNCTAAVLRAKKVVMDTVTTIQENAEDIYADAKQINEDRTAAEEAVEDVVEETAEEAVKAEAEEQVEA